MTDIVVRDAADNEGCAFSLKQLVDTGVVHKWADIVALQPTLAELLGVGVPVSCALERLNPMLLRELIGIEAIAGLRAPPFNFTARLYARDYATQLTPLALDALGVTLDKWLAVEGVMEIVGPRIRAILSLGPRRQWTKIGLTESRLVNVHTGITTIADIPWLDR